MTTTPKGPKGLASWLKTIEGEAKESAGNLTSYVNGSRERAAQILNASAVVAAMEISGENMETARIALESSILSLTRHGKAAAIFEGRQIALRAAWKLIALTLGV